MKTDMPGSLHNYLRMHRKRTGLYQEHVARLLGGRTETIVLRHEKVQRVPTLQAALAYAVIYRVSVDELFAGLKEEVEKDVRKRAVKLLDTVRSQQANAHLQALVDDSELRFVPCEE